MVVGGHHDNEVPDISDEEINLATEADGVEDHVAAYNDKHKDEIAAAAAKAAEEAAKHPAVETNNEIGSNASPAKTARICSALSNVKLEVRYKGTLCSL